jgi:hypothetical protein
MLHGFGWLVVVRRAEGAERARGVAEVPTTGGGHAMVK